MQPSSFPTGAAGALADRRSPLGPVPEQRGLSLSSVYGALAAVAVVSAVAQRLAHRLAVPETLRPMLAGSTGIAMLGMCIVGYVWVARAWEGVRAPTHMSAPEAAMRLVIPAYGLYWMFAVHSRLCAMLDARLAARGSSRAPGALPFSPPPPRWCGAPGRRPPRTSRWRASRSPVRRGSPT